MTRVLRGTIAAVLFAMAAFVYFYPSEARDYTQKRFHKFHDFAKPLLRLLFIPSNFVAKFPNAIVQGLGMGIAAGGVLALLDLKVPLLIFGYVLMVPGVLLHLPYAGLRPVGQLRKLIFLFAVFFCIVILAGIAPCHDRQEAEMVQDKHPNKAKNKKA